MYHEHQVEELRSEFDRWKKEQEHVIAMQILPKCLETIALVPVHLQSINNLLDKAIDSKSTDQELNKKTADEITSELETLRTWFDSNCLYLPRQIRKGFIGLLNITGTHTHNTLIPTDMPLPIDVWSSLLDKSKQMQEVLNLISERYNIVDRLIDDGTEKQ